MFEKAWAESFFKAMEPKTALKGVSRVMSNRTPAGDIEEFYVASYSRLVAVVGSIAGSREAGEEAVQEAFVRLLPRWDRVAAYQDPEGWVRRVAMQRLSSSRRKIRNSLSALALLRPHAHPSSSDLSETVRSGLRQLTLAQREVLVFHYYLGLGVEEVADELGIPVGTVKSRLQRGRANLAIAIAEEMKEDA